MSDQKDLKREYRLEVKDGEGNLKKQVSFHSLAALIKWAQQERQIRIAELNKQ
jgi:hypothetical protein